MSRIPDKKLWLEFSASRGIADNHNLTSTDTNLNLTSRIRSNKQLFLLHFFRITYLRYSIFSGSFGGSCGQTWCP